MATRSRRRSRSIRDPFIIHEGTAFVMLDALMERRHRDGDPVVLVELSGDEARRVERFRAESHTELAKLLAPRIRRRVGLKLDK